MSEFSIEEKANAYDLALNKAKTLLSKCKCDRNRTTMIYRAEDIESIFPELKEFSDEEIKKWLIGYFQEYKSTGIIEEFANGLKIDSIIAWLEKQDNNADKVEPKFNVGDWVVSHYNHVAHIKAIDEKNYFLSCDNGSCERLSIEYIDGNWRLWTIADVKEGDVLYSLDSCQPFIYKGRKSHEQATAYCGINKYDKFFVEKTEDYIIVLDKYVPATKEQRDFLFRKMKDAGYEWDAMKKQLKKL